MTNLLSCADNKNVLVIGGTSHRQAPRCVEQARSRGLKIILVDLGDNISTASDIVRLYDAVMPIQTKSPAQDLSTFQKLAQKERVIGALAIDEYSVELAAAIARHLDIPGNSPDAVALIRNKYACRQRLTEGGFLQPAARVCSSLDEGLEFFRANPSKRCIVKPISASGSLAVCELTNEAGLRAALGVVTDAGFDEFMIETFVDGAEYSVEGVFLDREPKFLGITQKKVMGGGNFIEVGHVTPAPLPIPTAQAIHDLVGRALRHVGLTHGLFHVEIWIDGSDIVVGEIHARAGGDYIHLLTELTSGVETYGCCFDDMLNRRLDTQAWRSMSFKYEGAAAIEYMTNPPGVISDLSISPQLFGDAQFVLISDDLRVGTRIPVLKWSRDRVGYIVAVGKDASDACHHVHRLIKMVQVKVSAP